MNDVFIQGRMIQVLERHVRPLLSGDAARAFYDCTLQACLSTALRHQKTFRAGSQAAPAATRIPARRCRPPGSRGGS